MALYVLVGPDGKVYEETAALSLTGAFELCPCNRLPLSDLPLGGPDWSWYDIYNEARRLGWRVRKFKIVLEEEL